MNSLNKLYKLENQYNVIEVLKYKDSTSWVDIKNYLYSKSLNGVVKSPNSNSRAYVSLDGIKLLLTSIKNYLKQSVFQREAKYIYFGAGSGLFNLNGKTHDSYFPEILKKDSGIYMLSAEFPKKLNSYSGYLNNNSAIIYSFLTAPFKIVMTKIINKFVKIDIDRELLLFLEKNFNTTKEEIIYIHSKYIASYWIYKLFIIPFKGKRAYIVSAYSNSAIIAALREQDIKVIELQHGVIGTTHRGYNYAVKSNLLPTPDKIFVYNDFWKQELIKANYFTTNQIEVTGRLKYELIDKDIKPYDCNYIVFTGQSGFYDEISKLINFSLAYLKDNKYKFVYIPHPNESKSDITNLKIKIKNLDFVEILSSAKPYTTEQYIFSSIAHISVYSSCHFDAIHYKSKTYIFDIMQDNPMQYYIENFPKQFIAIKNLEEIENV